MDEIEVTNILTFKSDIVIKRQSERVKSGIWPHLGQSWPGPNYMCKTKYETLGNG